MAYEYLKIEKGEGIAVVTLDRPPVNSLNVKAYQEIHDASCPAIPSVSSPLDGVAGRIQVNKCF
jgi:hypothetical protein